MGTKMMIVEMLVLAAVLCGSAQAVVKFYEPFDYTVAEALDYDAGSVWTQVEGTSIVTADGLTYGDLPVSGKALDLNAGGGYTNNSVASALGSAGLLVDGATVYMSALLDIGATTDASGKNVYIQLGTDYVNQFRQIENFGDSAMFGIGNARDVQLGFFQDGYNGGTGAKAKVATLSNDTEPGKMLVVLEMAWGATGSNDTLTLSIVDQTTLEITSTKSLSIDLDQIDFDVFSISGNGHSDPTKAIPLIDEIRIGESYDDVIGVDPFNPYPADGAVIPAANTLTLSWTNIYASEPNAVIYDVWFGTDTSTWAQVLTGAEDATSVDVDASVGGDYVWRIDVTIGDANTIEGDLYSFTTTNDPAPTVEILTPAMMTYSDNPVALDATVTDEGPSLLTYGWTASPDGVGDSNLIVDFVATDEDPVVTVTNTTGSMVTITMTLTAFDEANPEIPEASVEIDVYPDACAMAKNGENVPVADTDLNADCITNIVDLAEMAAAWLVDISSTAAVER